MDCILIRPSILGSLVGLSCDLTENNTGEIIMDHQLLRMLLDKARQGKESTKALYNSQDK